MDLLVTDPNGASPRSLVATDNRNRCEALSKEIATLAGQLNAANHRFLVLIAEFDERSGWAAEGLQTCAHWLNFKCGIDLGAAREKLRVAHALATLPRISAAMQRGQLSYSKVRALTRVATPEVEEALCDMALHSTAHHIETLVRHYKRCKDAEDLSREQQQQEKRAFSYHWDHDGSLVIKGRLPAETGALLLKALELAVEDIPRDESEVARIEALTQATEAAASIKFPPSRQRRADALGVLAETFLAHGPASLSGDRHQIVVHVSAETLRHSEAGQCEFEHGPSLAAETARRLACDASIVSIQEDAAGNPLSVGRKTRSIPPALRRALNARDRGCRFPGCCNTRFVDAHHIEHWAHGGETKLGNLVSLCKFHHRLMHEGGYEVEHLHDGAFRFVRSDGKSLNSMRRTDTQLFDWSDLNRRPSSCDIDEYASVSRWNGERVDYGLCVDVLMQRLHRGPGDKIAQHEWRWRREASAAGLQHSE